MGLPAEAPERPEGQSCLWVTFEREGRVVGRVACPQGRVRWGPGLGLEFTYPVPGVGRAEELFGRQGRAPCLRLLAGMDGEIAAGWSTRLSLGDVQTLGLARGRKGQQWLPLSPPMQGQVEYRGFRISFRFGPEPEADARGAAAAPPGRLPLRFRRGPLAREEWPFTLLAWGIYALLLYGAVQLAAHPLPLAPHPEAVAQRFARLIYEAPQAPTRARTEILKRQEAEKAAEPEPAPPEPEKAPEPPKVEPPKAEPAPAPAAPPTPAPPAPQVAEAPGPPAGPTAEQLARRREQLRESVANKGLLGLLGGRGATSTAAARGSILEGKGAAEDLDRVLARVDGLRAAPAGSGDQAGGGAPVLAAGLGENALRAAAGAQRTVQLQDRADEAVETVEDQPLDELTLREAVAAIHRTVGTYLGGIRYLYNRELRKKPDLEGKLTVSMTIDPEGTVTACEVVESTLGYPPLEEAVLDRVRKWKFPPVAPRPITVTYPFVFFPSM